MDVFFELFDLVSGNVVDDFATEDEAMEALRAAEREHGLEAIHDIALLRFENGHPSLVAMERDLAKRVSQSNIDQRVRVG